MKKFSVLILILALCVGSAFARIGIGAQGEYTFGNMPSFTSVELTFKSSTLPFVFGVDFDFAKDFYGIGLDVDYWFANPKLFSMLKWYLGPGITGTVYNSGGDISFYIGSRIFLGLNVFVIDELEIYLQTAAELGYTNFGGSGFAFHVPVGGGIRIWF